MAFLKARKSLVLAQRGKLPRTAGEDLMNIALMADIKQDTITRRIKDAVQRQGKLNDAQIA